MREKYFNVGMLVLIQTISWYLVLVFFATLAVLHLLDIEGVFAYGKYGIILILATVLAQLIVMAEQFRLSNLKRFWVMSYLLILILSAAAAWTYFR